MMGRALARAASLGPVARGIHAARPAHCDISATASDGGAPADG